MFERILIPLDGSSRAESIVRQVRRLLRQSNSELILLRSVAPMPVFSRAGPMTGMADEREEAQRYVHDLARRFGVEGARVRGRISDGPPAETILRAAEEEKATLIAMTTHGRTGLARWVFGSVTEKVLRASAVPVLVVRPPDKVKAV